MSNNDALRAGLDACGYACPFTREAHERGMVGHDYEPTPTAEPGLRAAAERAIDLTLGALRNGAVIDHPKSHAREAVIEAAVKYALAATPAAEPGLRARIEAALRESQDAWNHAPMTRPGTAYRTLERAIRAALAATNRDAEPPVAGTVAAIMAAGASLDVAMRAAELLPSEPEPPALDADEVLAALRVRVEDMPEPTGLKGGVSRLGVLSLIDAALLRSSAYRAVEAEPPARLTPTSEKAEPR